MTEEDKREIEATAARVKFNNSWPSGGLWIPEVQMQFEAWMKDCGYNQLLTPVIMEDSAIKVLFDNRLLNRLVSTFLDIYDQLPYHPDKAFDVAWRAFEILLNLHNNELWKDKNDKTVHLVSKGVNYIVLPLADQRSDYKASLEKILNDIPLSVLKYTVLRMYVEHEMAINPHINRSSERAKAILSPSLYDDIKEQYKLQEDKKPDKVTLRKCALLLQKVLRGEKLIINGHHHTLDFNKRIEFVISCMLFFIFFERAHGDYFSPFKSDRAHLDTYAFSYYMLIMSYILMWTVMYYHCSKLKVGVVCKMESIIASADESYSRLIPLIRLGKES